MIEAILWTMLWMAIWCGLVVLGLVITGLFLLMVCVLVVAAGCGGVADIVRGWK